MGLNTWLRRDVCLVST